MVPRLNPSSELYGSPHGWNSKKAITGSSHLLFAGGFGTTAIWGDVSDAGALTLGAGTEATGGLTTGAGAGTGTGAGAAAAVGGASISGVGATAAGGTLMLGGGTTGAAGGGVVTAGTGI